jgi:RNA polymerase sigma-70 factor (ECF subfamily)
MHAVNDARSELDRVRAAAAGDVAAYEELYRANVGRIYALCLRMTRDRDAAEELTQDVFVRAWDRLASFRGESAFSTWLHRVAVNVVLGALRKRRRWLSRHAHADLDDAAAELVGQASPSPRKLDLERSIAALPPRARLVFVLHDVEGYRHAEIASQMGVAVGTCKAHLHRARSLLKEALER